MIHLHVMDKRDAALPTLVPLLVVRDAGRAVDFYVDSLGAKQLRLYLHPTTKAISHVDLAIQGATFSITEEARAWNSDAPPSLGGSPVVLQLYVREVDALFERMCSAGATIVFPLQEFAGERMGRVRDPFGHLWLLRAGPAAGPEPVRWPHRRGPGPASAS